MRLFVLSAWIVAGLSCLSNSASGDEAAVKEMVRAYAGAFNARQLDAVKSFWTEEAVHIDRSTGERTEGREAIVKDIAEVFEEIPSTRIYGRLDHVRMITEEVASVDGEITVSIPGAAPSVNQFSAILVQQEGKWMIEEIAEMPVSTPASSSDALQELSWLLGRWVDEGEGMRVDTEFSWTSSQAFLLRSYVVQTSDGVMREGTQVIGWDPRSEEIRSWSFNSDGSFGDGVWSKAGDDWLIKASQTLADGRAASGTYILSRLGSDELSLQLVAHEIEGEPQPSQEPVRVARIPEQQVSTDKTPPTE